jgi:hypothetical protein
VYGRLCCCRVVLTCGKWDNCNAVKRSATARVGITASAGLFGELEKFDGLERVMIM